MIDIPCRGSGGLCRSCGDPDSREPYFPDWLTIQHMESQEIIQLNLKFAENCDKLDGVP